MKFIQCFIQPCWTTYFQFLKKLIINFTRIENSVNKNSKISRRRPWEQSELHVLKLLLKKRTAGQVKINSNIDTTTTVTKPWSHSDALEPLQSEVSVFHTALPILIAYRKFSPNYFRSTDYDPKFKLSIF